MHRLRQVTSFLGLVVALTACGSDDGGRDESCTPGELLCECHMGSCFGVLACENNICVQAAGTGDGDGDPGDGDGDPGDGDADPGDDDGDNTGDGDGDGCGSGETLCSGNCVNLTTDDANCGSCGNACDIVDGYGGCSDGVCDPTLSECVLTDNPPKSCNQVCAESGKSCVVDGCNGGRTLIWYDTTSDCQTFFAGDPGPDDCAEPMTDAGLYYRCCCQ